MKKFLSFIGVAALLLATIIPLKAQVDTNAPPLPGWKWIQFLSATNTSWAAAVAPSYAPDLKDSNGRDAQWGAGVLVGYWVSPYVLTAMRFDYLGNSFFSVEGSATAQAPMKLFNTVTVSPFATTGIATPLSGAGSENGTPIWIAGAGISSTVYKWSYGSVNLLFESEKWTGVFNNPIVYHGGVEINIHGK